MTNEERDLITAFIARVAGAAPPSGPAGSPWGTPGAGAGVPAAPPLPPIDPEADALLATLFQHYPEARYRLAQLAFVQEHALVAGQARIRQLETQVQQAAPAPAHGGFFSGLFGGHAAPARPSPPLPGPGGYPPAGSAPGAYPPGGYPPGAYSPGAPPMGLLQRSGPGFLGSALTTAAGVAGGMVLGNALMDMFSSGRAAADQGALPAADTAWGAPAEPAGWVAPDPAALDPPDPGAWSDPGADPGADPFGGGQDPGDGGWDQGGFDPGGGWDPGGGSDDTLV